jgi:hypothetical protein
MRLILLPLSALAIIGAAPVPAALGGSPDAMMPGYARPAERWTSIDQALSDKQCADRIEQVRDAAGQPALDKMPATADDGYLMAAVDKRIDGCPVMQMLHDIDDVRPVPQVEQRPVYLMPAR